MGKIVTHADPKGHKFYRHEHVVKIMFDDNEPPKNYLWHKPNGILYEYVNGEWVPINRKANLSEYITRRELEQYIQEEILSKLSSLIDLDTSGFIKLEDLAAFATKEWVNQQDFGKTIDLSDYVTAEEVSVEDMDSLAEMYI
jgi:hypothetical protein